jgi:hypothetical protein
MVSTERIPSVLMHLPKGREGGLETHIIQLSLALRRSGAVVSLIARQRFAPNPERRVAVDAAGVGITPLPDLYKRNQFVRCTGCGNAVAGLAVNENELEVKVRCNWP